MSLRRSRRLHQAAALGLFALSCGIGWTALVQPLSRVTQEGWTQHRQSMRELGRLGALASHQGQLEAALATANDDPAWTRLYRAESASAATAMLQGDVQSVARVLGVSIISMQPAAPRDMGPISRIGVRIALLVPLDLAMNFVRLLSDSPRLLVIGDASIVAPHSHEADTNPLLTIQFEISGIWDGGA